MWTWKIETVTEPVDNSRASELCWEAYTNSDQTEWRGHDVTIAFFTHRKDAVKAARNAGPMGTDGSVRKVQRPKVFESYADYEKHVKLDLRERALQKLTAEERQALGL